MGYYKKRLAAAGHPFRLTGVSHQIEDGQLHISCASEFNYGQLMEPAHHELLAEAVAQYFGPAVRLVIHQPAPTLSKKDIEAKITAHPVVQAVQTELAARIVHMDQRSEQS